MAAVMSLIILMSGSYQNWYLLIAFFFQNCSEFPDSLYVVIFNFILFSWEYDYYYFFLIKAGDRYGKV